MSCVLSGINCFAGAVLPPSQMVLFDSASLCILKSRHTSYSPTCSCHFLRQHLLQGMPAHSHRKAISIFSRVVTVSSMAHKTGAIFFDDLGFKSITYRPFKVCPINVFLTFYCQKLPKEHPWISNSYFFFLGLRPVKASKHSLHKGTSKASKNILIWKSFFFTSLLLVILVQRL